MNAQNLDVLELMITVAVWVVGIIAGLIALMLNWIFQRLKTLHHDDREVRNQYLIILQTMESHQREVLKPIAQAMQIIASFYKLREATYPKRRKEDVAEGLSKPLQDLESDDLP